MAAGSMALAIWPYGPMASNSCFKKFSKIDRISLFYLYLHIKLQLSGKLRCVEPTHALSRHWMFLVPYYFYVSYQESQKVKRKAESRCLFKTPVLEPWLTRHTPET